MSDLECAYWWSEHAAPGDPSTGTTYIYGAACTRVRCAFDDLRPLRRGEVVWVRTADIVSSYRVLAESITLRKTPAGIGSRSIYGYAPDGSSPFSWAVIAQLVGAARYGQLPAGGRITTVSTRRDPGRHRNDRAIRHSPQPDRRIPCCRWD